MRKLFTVVAVVLFLTGCATGYHRAGISGGYFHKQLGGDFFQVTYLYNLYTSIERAEDMNLLRCAEVALQNDFNYFIIVNTENKIEPDKKSRAYLYENYAHGSAKTTEDQTDFSPSPFGKVVNQIRCFENRPEVEDGWYFDAIFVEKTIKAKYQIKGPQVLYW